MLGIVNHLHIICQNTEDVLDKVKIVSSKQNNAVDVTGDITKVHVQL